MSQIIYRDDEADTQLGIHAQGARYGYDLKLGKGWEQYDTEEDAWYYGIWVNIDERKIFTYAEGDRVLQCFDTQISFVAELLRLHTRYGKVPPAFVGIDETGVTHFIAPRPGDNLLGLHA